MGRDAHLADDGAYVDDEPALAGGHVRHGGLADAQDGEHVRVEDGGYVLDRAVQQWACVAAPSVFLGHSGFAGAGVPWQGAPALLTTMSMRPSRSMIVAMTAFTFVSFVTSSVRGSMLACVKHSMASSRRAVA